MVSGGGNKYIDDIDLITTSNLIDDINDEDILIEIDDDIIKKINGKLLKKIFTKSLDIFRFII